jgi:hypothetical protein
MSKDHKELAPPGTVLVAKMVAQAPFQWPPDQEGNRTENVQLSAVYTENFDDPNKEWSKWTPGGSLQLNVSNPAAHGRVTPGKEYYVFVVEAD